MISNLDLVIIIGALFIIVLFIAWNVRHKQFALLNRVYLGMAVAYVIWLLALLGMRIVGMHNMDALFWLDAVTNGAGVFMPALGLLIALCFVNGWEKMPKWSYLVFGIPILTNIVVWTNPLHHLQYKVFSIIKSDLVFGPYIFVTGIYSYLCQLTGIVIMIYFANKHKSRLYWIQSILISLGSVIPMLTSIFCTIGNSAKITTTPISFLATIFCNGLAIYKLHFLDIKPLAIQKIMERITDSYLILSEKGLVISYNLAFVKNFGERYGIQENHFLVKSLEKCRADEKNFLFNLLNAINSAKEGHSVITYEQASQVTTETGEVKKNYYIVETTVLMNNDKVNGFAVIFRDITELKKSMEQLQNSQRRMMEQERLAFLGQMIGGLAHNLKTPIMSISGCVEAMKELVEEYQESLDDPLVEKNDYLEICQDMKGWLEKVQESTGYMSDIITAIKGQAAATTSDSIMDQVFTLDEMEKRCKLLMRHELQQGRCVLKTEFNNMHNIVIHGDINSLVQVVNNLISNAIDAQENTDRKEICLRVSSDNNSLVLEVVDWGCGVSPDIQKKLFKNMVTSKGIKGNGLGLYISYAAIRGKFGGDMWYKNNPDGGSIFGIVIPGNLIEPNNI